MGGIANPQLIRSMVDGCNWLASIPDYPLKNSMLSIIKIAAEGAGGGWPLSATIRTWLSTSHPIPMIIPVPT
jgi:hypothetical protein